MSENVKNFIDKLSLGQAAEAGDAFKTALRDKVGDALELKRKELASTLFQGEAEKFSDPKPEVLSPSAKTEPVVNGEQSK